MQRLAATLALATPFARKRNHRNDFNMELDRFDRQLLNLVQKNAMQTAEQMAEIVALSPSAVQRRLRRMREQGTIANYVAVIEPAHVGKPVTFIVAVQVEREGAALLDQFKKWISEQDQVQQAFYVTGEADFILVVTAPDTEAYDALMSRMVHDNPNVKRFTTNVALNTVKRGLTIPVPLGTASTSA